MSTVIDRWKSEECRSEDGIYFPDDTYIPLIANLPLGFRQPMATLLASAPDAWSGVYAGEPLAQSDEYVIYGGETSWEGAGFLALVSAHNHSLIWLLHSAESEAFQSAEIRAEVILASSGNYPVRYSWRIPLSKPETLAAEASDA